MTAARPYSPVRAGDDTAADEFIYDAFISYSGFRKAGAAWQLDRRVAERLHRSLEAYRVPRALAGKAPGRGPIPRRLKKIFRDRDEVRAGNSLHGSLSEALRRSRFLIVICSPRARQSQWINEEIATFHRLGRSEQILPLLIEGEPVEAFPAELFRAQPEGSAGAQARWLAQPLAADIRAPSVSKSLRLLKEEKLRLIAAILGCEYDDLRQREHARFVRRATTAAAAMLAGLLVLASLSLLLYLARQREQRNKQLAISATAAILPLTGLEPDAPPGATDPVTREVFIKSAIGYLETIREDDPENLKCLTTLQALYGGMAGLLMDRGRREDALAYFQKADSMVIPVALSRLRAWRPTQARRVKELTGETLSFPKNYDLTRLRALLDIMERREGAADVKTASAYVEVAAEYVPLLDTSAREGQAEARRVLQSSLDKFEQARSPAALTGPQEELVKVIKAALDRLPPGG